MLRDVFYYGKKPNVHPREKFATSLTDARQQSATEHFWVINEYCDYKDFDWDFDFDFLPDEDVWAQDHNNVWPSQHQKDSGTWLCSKNDSQIVIYRNDVEPVKRKNEIGNHWVILKNIDKDKFDFSWHHDPTDPPYIYVFGNQWYDSTIEPTIEYHVKGATQRKYMMLPLATILPEMDKYKFYKDKDQISFDYSWHPNPYEPPYIFVFGSQWYDSATDPVLEYHSENATQRKYLNYPTARMLPDMTNYTVYDNTDLKTFDFSWYPNPHSPPQVYQWADNGPRYTVPDATEVVYMERETTKIVDCYYIKTTLEDLIIEHKNEVFWALNPELNYSGFDFSWRPNKDTFRHINVFGNEFSKNTQTYYVNGPMYMLGHRDLNYVEGHTLNLDSNLSMFFIDKSNKESAQRFNTLKLRYPQLQKTRYLNSWVDTINRCVGKSETKLFWVLSSELDYTDFKFDFYPSPWQESMLHVFGTQYNHWGNTYLVNKEKFPEDTKYVKVIEHLSSINFVKNKRATAKDVLHEIVYIDHGNIPEKVKELSQSGHIVVKYTENYLETFKRVLEKLPNKKEHYIWIVSTICDYSDFDFSYICDPFSREQLHVFPSNKQKFGDTFFVDVNNLRLVINNLSQLKDFTKINFNNYQRVQRLPAPEFIVDEDTLVNVADLDYDFPYAVVHTKDNENLIVTDPEPLSLWAEKNILITSTGGTRLIVPKEIKNYVKKELYDYPYIISNDKLAQSNPLDIVFVSNGELCADKNYEHLLNITKNFDNRVSRVDGINGRTQALHAAANQSKSLWFYCVPAKLYTNNEFDFNFQPDRLQIPKHYMFNAYNPVNDLYYGHQAMILYSKKLVLENPGLGLDFTLDSEHTSVDLNCGTVVGDTDEYSTWRTAFREAVKLKNFYETSEDKVAKERLDIWANVGKGKYGSWSIKGAIDGIEFYNEVNGDTQKLRQSYYWDWLKQRFDSKY